VFILRSTGSRRSRYIGRMIHVYTIGYSYRGQLLGGLLFVMSAHCVSDY